MTCTWSHNKYIEILIFNDGRIRINLHLITPVCIIATDSRCFEVTIMGVNLALKASVNWLFHWYNINALFLFNRVHAKVEADLYVNRCTKPSMVQGLIIWTNQCNSRILEYSYFSGPSHPPKVKYTLKAIIVACSYTVAFQDHHTLPNI